MPPATEDRYELALNGEGQPTFNSLPAILSMLDSEETEERAEGASYLAQLVDSSYGDDATIFADYLREAGGIEVIAELLLDPEPFIQQKVLMVVGNLASDAFDPNSAATKAIFKQHDVMARLSPFLSSREWVTQLYATAAVQNLAKDVDLAKEALQLGVHKVVQRLLRSEHELVVRYGARRPGSSAAMMRAPPRRSPAPALCGRHRHDALTWLSAAAGALKNLQDARELEIEEARGNAESGRSRRSCQEVALHGPRVRSPSLRATSAASPTSTPSHLDASPLSFAAGLAAVVGEEARSARSSRRRSSSWAPRRRRPSGAASSRRSWRRRRGS
tara:strand:- start:866 stop:1861 length:996 start_codon:yes stop_codon:yes gene_type:complete